MLGLFLYDGTVNNGEVLPSAGNMLSFVVGGKQAFEVSIADVSQTQMMGKNDVVLEFHVDDTTGANEVTFPFTS
jgi:hypothetical protein